MSLTKEDQDSIDRGVQAINNLLNIEINDPEILEQARKTGSPIAAVYDMCVKTFVR